MRIAPNYHFNGDCREALALYARAFNAEITVLMHYRDARPEDMQVDGLSDHAKGRVYHAEMLIAGQRFMFSDSLNEVPRGQNISMVVLFETPDAVKSAMAVLAEGGTVLTPLQTTTYSGAFVSLVDRFGMRWELIAERAGAPA